MKIIKKITAVLLTAAMLFTTAPVFASDLALYDYSDWAEAELTAADDAGLFVFTGGGDLTADISRLYFCRLLANMLDEIGVLKENDAVNPFADTDDANVLALTAAGIVKGTSDTTFEPELSITREEAATLLARAAVYMGLTVPELMDDYPYADYAEISIWALDPVREMFSAQIMLGTGENMFSPAEHYSREQAIATVKRLYDAYNTQSDSGALQPKPSDSVQQEGSFTARLTSAMSKTENYCVSPLSIRIALAMAANGADGETKTQLLNAIGIDDIDAFNESARTLIEKYSENGAIKLNISNSLWLNSDKTALTFKKSFQTLISKFYSGDTSVVNDKNAVATINRWVYESTGGKIDGIISSSDFSAVLINAIYFKGAWKNVFTSTEDGTFTDASGAKKDVSFMCQTDRFSTGTSADGARIVELPYSLFYNEKGIEDALYDSDKNVSMYIIMTDESNPDIEQILNDTQLTTRRVELKMPAFRIETSLSLGDILTGMGAVDAFDPELADFGEMYDGGNMYISDVLHKTYIDVDSEGTEAAAVTAVMMAETALIDEGETVQFYADHPFWYAIRENGTGEILFVGEYLYTK